MNSVWRVVDSKRQLPNLTINRRKFAAAMVGLVAGTAFGDQDKPAAPDHITPEAQRAIDRGLSVLARFQQSDGSYGMGDQLSGNVAITSLAGLAFMAGGHQPDRGIYGRQVTRAIEYVLSQEDRNIPGFLYHRVNSTHGPMYSHGFGTMFLAEAYGQIANAALAKRTRSTLERAVQLTLASQHRDGGWRYQPRPDSADVSVTICQIMALRSARNAGLAVPKSAADRCIEYVKACQLSDGGFSYYKRGGGSDFPRSAAGLCALYSAGQYEGKEIERALNYLMISKPGPNRRAIQTHYYYGHYYAAQAFWTAGEPRWSEWFPAIRDDLVSRQGSDGIWIDRMFGNDYATAMALIILQIPNNYLPILQK